MVIISFTRCQPSGCPSHPPTAVIPEHQPNLCTRQLGHSAACRVLSQRNSPLMEWNIFPFQTYENKFPFFSNTLDLFVCINNKAIKTDCHEEKISRKIF